MAVLFYEILIYFLSSIATGTLAGIYLPKRSYTFHIPASVSPGRHIGTIYVVKNSIITCKHSNTLGTVKQNNSNIMNVSAAITERYILLNVEQVINSLDGALTFNLSLRCTDENDPGFLYPQLWYANVTLEILPSTSVEYPLTNMSPEIKKRLIQEICPYDSSLSYNIIENSEVSFMDTFEGYQHFVPRKFSNYDVRFTILKNSTDHMVIDSTKWGLSLTSSPDREKTRWIRAHVECHVSYKKGTPLSEKPIIRQAVVSVMDLDDSPPVIMPTTFPIQIEINEKGEIVDQKFIILTDQDSENVTNNGTYEITSDAPKGMLTLKNDYIFLEKQTLIKSAIPAGSTKITPPRTVNVTFRDKTYKSPNGHSRSSGEISCTILFVPKKKTETSKNIVQSDESSKSVDLNVLAAKYALITIMEAPNAVIGASDWRISNTFPPLFKGCADVSQEGEVYVHDIKTCNSGVSGASPVLTVDLFTGQKDPLQQFRRTIMMNDLFVPPANGTCDKGCSVHKTEKACVAACGYGAVSGRCEWHQMTCTPNKRTCPDGHCSALEQIDLSICPQDCADANGTVASHGTSRASTDGLCSCSVTPGPCPCDEQQSGQGGSVDSQNSNGTLRVKPISDTRCSHACRAGIASSVLVFLMLVVAAVVGRIFWRRRQEQRRLPSLKHVSSLVSMSAIPSDYIVDDSRDSRTHINRQTLSPTSGHWMSKTAGNSNQEVIEDEWEFPRQHLSLENIIGEGEFGQVVKAQATMCQGSESEVKVVAVKMLKPDASGAEYQDLVSEFQMLKEVEHPNVIKLLGVCTQKGPLYVIVEFCELGSLRSFLRASKFKNKGSWEEKQKNGSVFTESQETPAEARILTPRDLFSFAWQISKGMDYLAGLKIVHRDLAARNVLVKEGWQIKISDFGLSRDVYEANQYLKMSKGRIPVKWMAPESLYGQIYTTKSDTWSYGIVLWEIVTLGASPYPGIPPERLFPLLSTGYRMDRPDDCPEELYAIMQKCWKSAPEDRPRFAVLRDILDHILQQNTGYLELPDNRVHPFHNFPSFPKQVSADRTRPASTTRCLLSSATDKRPSLDEPLPHYGNIVGINGHNDLGSSPNSAPQIPVTMTHWHGADDESDRESCPESSKLLDDEERNSFNRYRNSNSAHVVTKPSNNILSSNKNAAKLCPRITVHENLTYA